MRLIDADALIKDIAESIRLADEWEKESRKKKDNHGLKCAIDTRRSLMAMISRVKEAPTIEAEPVRHGRWIECDYKHMEHGMIETEPKAGLCCSECRTAFQKKKMTYKQYCAACGTRMDADHIADNSKKVGGV